MIVSDRDFRVMDLMGTMMAAVPTARTSSKEWSSSYLIYNKSKKRSEIRLVLMSILNYGRWMNIERKGVYLTGRISTVQRRDFAISMQVLLVMLWMMLVVLSGMTRVYFVSGFFLTPINPAAENSSISDLV